MERSSPVKIVVLVDDDEDVLFSLERDLQDWAQRRRVTIQTALSAEEALRLVHEEYPAVGLVVSDLRMPGMNGADLLVQLNQSFPDIGCIMVTAYSDMDQITRAVSSSLLGLIQKPWEPPRLVEDLDRALEHVVERRTTAERNHDLTRQLELAGAFQRSAVAVSIPPDQRISFGFLSRPAREMHVTGDFSDLLRLDDHRYLILVGDVAGHGVRAALLSAMLKIVVRTYAEQLNEPVAGPAAVLELFNRHMLEYIPDSQGMIASCVSAVVDLSGETVSIANAGHPPAYVVRREEYSFSSLLDPALGMDAGAEYAEETIPMGAGERLVLYTDGLYRSAFGSGEEFSATRMGTVLQAAHRSARFEENVVRLITAERILHGQPTVPLFDDDLTLASLQIR